MCQGEDLGGRQCLVRAIRDHAQACEGHTELVADLGSHGALHFFTKRAWDRLENPRPRFPGPNDLIARRDGAQPHP